MKDIKGYEGRYAIDKKGRVWSLKNKLFLKHKTGTRGYLYVTLTDYGKHRNYSVHRLLALTFIPNPNNYLEVDHIYHNKLDNRLSKLRWVTHSINCRNKSKSLHKSSQYLGVYYHKNIKRWIARVTVLDEHKFLGSFLTELEAKNAHYKYTEKYFKGIYK